MVELLVIPDGASERPGEAPTSLEAARTPVLDDLAARGAVGLCATTPAGLGPGSETGIPTLLGARLGARPARGLIEAAAAGIEVPRGWSAWRVDLYVAGARFVPAEPALTAVELGLPAHALHYLYGHRYLAVGPRAPAPRHRVIEARVWGGEGVPLASALDHSTVVVCGPGAAAGIGRMLGARVEVPAGATGGSDTDLGAKAAAALAALEGGARRVVVHVAWPDEAAHEHDRASKVAALEAIDALVLAPLADFALARGIGMRVCPDHGTNPASGEHIADAVPCVRVAAGVEPSGPARMTERLLVGAVAANGLGSTPGETDPRAPSADPLPRGTRSRTVSGSGPVDSVLPGAPAGAVARSGATE